VQTLLALKKWLMQCRHRASNLFLITTSDRMQFVAYGLCASFDLIDLILTGISGIIEERLIEVKGIFFIMNQTVLITGASRGIGAQAARTFAQAGYRVALNYCHSQQEAQALQKELNQQGAQALAVQADVQNRSEVDRMIAQIEAQLGSIDILVNNAGIAQQKLFTDLTEAEWDAMFGVNMKGMFHCTQAVLPSMIRRQCGTVVNVSSMWGVSGASCEVHYSASKAAVIGFTKALAKEVGPSHIRVNCVAPGVISTDMNAALSEETLTQLKDETPLCTLGTPQDIANVILFLASEKSAFITGQTITVDGGMIL
jgi:3-oxoacyl-[acyl-carrier protein] reductase